MNDLTLLRISITYISDRTFIRIGEYSHSYDTKTSNSCLAPHDVNIIINIEYPSPIILIELIEKVSNNIFVSVIDDDLVIDSGSLLTNRMVMIDVIKEIIHIVPSSIMIELYRSNVHVKNEVVTLDSIMEFVDQTNIKSNWNCNII